MDFEQAHSRVIGSGARPVARRSVTGLVFGDGRRKQGAKTHAGGVEQAHRVPDVLVPHHKLAPFAKISA